ncbi:amino acid ABC transporter permease [Bordetella genomosp. 10]|uniref:Amino acid ABC transporter permease n=1 Tax=Bordetella genomosp. 10 TaxID=1416804 RepID=A0A261SM09_9BORD|nr:amino acid ABC transporter permease [Bordetella genomosp. 10]OZI38458.1 amino acid ABC transporter permease [Bordetella genomosp. 10]
MLEIIRKYGMLLLVGPWPHGPLGGIAATLILAALGLSLSFPVALLLGLARTSSWRWLRWPANAWVYGLRGIPLVMIIFWAYYLLPLLTGDAISPFATALCAIVCYEAAFMAEIVRAGIQGLPSGQTEAARAAGLTYAQSMVHVILPQALVNMLPSIVNQFISTIKATSIVYIIGVQEATFAAQEINSVEMTHALQTYLLLACIYFLLCYGLSFTAAAVERHFRLRRTAAGAALAA